MAGLVERLTGTRWSCPGVHRYCPSLRLDDIELSFVDNKQSSKRSNGQLTETWCFWRDLWNVENGKAQMSELVYLDCASFEQVPGVASYPFLHYGSHCSFSLHVMLQSNPEAQKLSRCCKFASFSAILCDVCTYRQSFCDWRCNNQHAGVRRPKV